MTLRTFPLLYYFMCIHLFKNLAWRYLPAIAKPVAKPPKRYLMLYLFNSYIVTYYDITHLSAIVLFYVYTPV